MRKESECPGLEKSRQKVHLYQEEERERHRERFGKLHCMYDRGKRFFASCTSNGTTSGVKSRYKVHVFVLL